MVRVKAETSRLCHSCSGQPAFKLVYTVYGADIVLCQRCAWGLLEQLRDIKCLKDLKGMGIDGKGDIQG